MKPNQTILLLTLLINYANAATEITGTISKEKISKKLDDLRNAASLATPYQLPNKYRGYLVLEEKLVRLATNFTQGYLGNLASCLADLGQIYSPTQSDQAGKILDLTENEEIWTFA